MVPESSACKYRGAWYRGSEVILEFMQRAMMAKRRQRRQDSVRRHVVLCRGRAMGDNKLLYLSGLAKGFQSPKGMAVGTTATATGSVIQSSSCGSGPSRRIVPSVGACVSGLPRKRTGSWFCWGQGGVARQAG
jgi:hypothetical protein